MNELTQQKPVGAALVVGGGIGGMQAALDLAESGIKVYMAERQPSIGGVMSQLDKTFPTNDCAMCTIAPRLVDIGRHKDIDILTLSEVESIRGSAGNFSVTIRRNARHVDESRCTGCGTCVGSCPTRNVVQPAVHAKTPVPAQFRDTVARVLEKHRHREGPLMPILQEINAALNYLPPDVLRCVADETGYPLAHVLKVATFYGAFSIVPRGKHIVNVCMGTTCYVRGSERLMEKFSEKLKIAPGETTPDMNFTLKSVRCIGCCGLAPAVTVGDRVYGKLTFRQVPEIIEKYSKGFRDAKTHD